MLAAALPLVAFLSGCGEDPLTPIVWTSVVDTATIYSLARPELDLLSAFNFHDRTGIRLERVGQAEQWDIALDTRGGQLVLLPPGALGVTSEARIVPLPGQPYETAAEAPKDTALYSSTQPLPVVVDRLYVVKTGVRATELGGICGYYAKMKPIAIDAAQGSMTFVYEANPVCNDRSLVPPDTT